MDIAQAESRILKRDWDVRDDIGKLGQPAIAMLRKLAEHKDSGVRELAVSCLGVFRGSEPAAALTDALRDPEGDVRVEACNQLQVAHDPSVLPKLTSILSEHGDEFVREKVALTIGRIGDPNSIEPLQKQRGLEKATEVRSAIVLALARLGQKEARDQILGELKTGNVKTQCKAMEKLEYVADKALAAHIKPFLNDMRPAFNTVADPRPITVRVADVAMKTVAVLFNQPFPFSLKGYRPCTDAELQQGREFMRAK